MNAASDNDLQEFDNNSERNSFNCRKYPYEIGSGRPAAKDWRRLMNVTGVGGSSYLQSMQSMRQPMATGGVNAREMADNEMARKALPMQSAGVAAPAATEAKGLYCATYASPTAHTRATLKPGPWS